MGTPSLFKGEPNAKHGKEISFVTNGSSAACGVTLELGRQYLIGLYRDGDGSFTANSCGLVRRWDDVTKEERASLRTGCEEDDPCDGSCGEFQVRDDLNVLLPSVRWFPLVIPMGLSQADAIDKIMSRVADGKIRMSALVFVLGDGMRNR